MRVFPRLALRIDAAADGRKYSMALRIKTKWNSKGPKTLADRASVVFGLVALAFVLVRALRRRCPSAGLCTAVFLAVLGNAVITGGLSTPHDRYQSRVVWLPAAMVLLALPGGRMLADLRGARGAVLRGARGAVGDAILLRPSIRSRAYA